MGGGGREIRVAQAAEDMKVGVWGGFVMKEFMWYGETYSLTRP
jgi:hypothetical protein